MQPIEPQFHGHGGPKYLDNVTTIAVATLFLKNLGLRLNKRKFAAV